MDEEPRADEQQAEIFAAEVVELAERFTYDFARLTAGHDVDFSDYVEAPVAARLLRNVEPFLATGDAMRPNLGDRGQLRIAPKGAETLIEHGEAIADVYFDYLSARETAQDVLPPAARRRWQLTLIVDLDQRRIVNYRLRPQRK